MEIARTKFVHMKGKRPSPLTRDIAALHRCRSRLPCRRSASVIAVPHCAEVFRLEEAVQSPSGWRPPNGMGDMENHRRGGQIPANETSPLGGPGPTSETATPLLPLQIKSQPTHFWSDGQLPGRASRPADRRGHLSAVSVHRNWIPQPLQIIPELPAGNIALSRRHRELPAHRTRTCRRIAQQGFSVTTLPCEYLFFAGS
ncbi:hypothetical protein HaLaN_07582 [Haematococcus lacustris]|uniref:Uncharacterized protein n=1 Tax=Haematococcus lacustris TaxID=44745 RepID=A0A699YY97_HAELA|nr:hypothetical protein HaLaN_07582 [Haematococcus lacustris]